MIDLQAYLEKKLRGIISTWHADDIYAISFFVYANEVYEYDGFSNVTQFFVSYQTESDCCGEDELSEERWNYAFWQQNETPVIEADDGDEGMKILFDWYRENGIEHIGCYEDPAACYDEKMRYIGKAPPATTSCFPRSPRLPANYILAVSSRRNSADRFPSSFTSWNIRGTAWRQRQRPTPTEKPIHFSPR